MIDSLLFDDVLMFRLLCLIAFFTFNANAIVLEDYLPDDFRYQTAIPTPKAVTGVEVGERHYRHDQIVQYMSVLAASSPRAKLVEYGRTNEGRRLVLLFISSEENIKNLEQLPNDDSILKVWNGFSVHGNETSGANASVIYAYHLIAGYSDELNQLLNETLIIIDPVINPDGYDRFITDVNSMRGMIDNPDSNDASHHEQTPNGRTNHYWFDLNRDWLLLTQTESQHRIQQFQKWQPHVLDDHHEMGSDKTFFFQPGVPQRTNPLIPQKNIELTNKLAQFHSKTLDEKQALYYSREDYDDFYPGKGSTYPDLHGSIGILFEQASARGGNLQTSEGKRLLWQGIDNQFRTAVSTLQGAYALKSELINYKKQFYNNALKQADKENFKGYILSADNVYNAEKLSNFLSSHNIQYSKLKVDVSADNKDFPAEKSIFIPVQQPQYTLIQALFSEQKKFTDNTFYDVSAWNLVMAWGLNSAKLKTTPETEDANWKKPHNSYRKNALAYAFNWDEGNSAGALNYLQQKKVTTKALAKEFTIKSNGHTVIFKPGAIIIPTNDIKEDELLTLLSNLAEFFKVSAFAITSGLNSNGVDLGSPSFTTLKSPKALLVIGEGVNSYQAGSIWHLFDAEIGLALTKVDTGRFAKIDLDEYSHLIMPSGNYKMLDEKSIEKMNQWVKQGGTLISLQKSSLWVEKNIQKFVKEAEKDDSEKVRKSYADFEKDNAENIIGGAIVAATADLSHPLGFGMHQQDQYVMLQGKAMLEPSKNPYVTTLKAPKNALAAGYLSEQMKNLVNDSSLLIAEKHGKGNLIKFAFNPNFRGFWKGTQKWLINSVYLSSLIQKTEIED